ncbi:hypothetical protein ACRYWZ_14740 [Agrobacterium deltaense]|uniref:hypothetical protein n=1 Tax=Agrobacterium deltaense TaxID=1183412 RepID=UPI003D99872B
MRRWTKLDRKDAISPIILVAIRNADAGCPQEEAALPEHLIIMLEALNRGLLQGMRNRVMLLIGVAAGCATRRSSGQIADATGPKTAVAGSKSSTRACSLPRAVRPVGERL